MQLKSHKYFPKNSGPKIGHHSNLSRNQSYLDQVTLQSLIFQLGPVLSDDQFFGHFILTWKPYLQFALKAKNIKKLTLCFSRCELRPFFGSHARTSHVQIKVRMHTCAHTQFEVVALRTRTFGKIMFRGNHFLHQSFKLFLAIFQYLYGLVCSKTK